MTQMRLVAERPNRHEISQGAFVELHPKWLDRSQADDLFTHCTTELAWQHREFRDGVMMPRLELIVGEPGMQYHYSGLTYQTRPWTPPLRWLLDRVANKCRAEFSAVFCNLYRNERDSIGWHADFERNLGPRWPDNITIASVSLGATRRFAMRPKEHDNVKSIRRDYELAHGDLLVMSGATQQSWEHCIPKESSAREPRVNLTFRVLR